MLATETSPAAIHRRCFVAVLPDAATVDALVALQRPVGEQAGEAEAGRILPEDMHLTLAFLGDREAETCDRLVRALAALDLAGLEQALKFRCVEGWGRRQRVCVAVFAASRAWTAVLRRVWQALEPCDWTRPTQRFRPHVTLWRARGARAPTACGPGANGAPAFRPSTLALMAQNESPGPRRYRTLWRRAIVESG